MIRIFSNSKNLLTKIKSMQITLFASVHCNRYSAMDIFDRMLQQINSEQEAFAVVEMLKDNLDYYKNIVDRVPSSILHSIIRKFQLETLNQINNENSNSDSVLDFL